MKKLLVILLLVVGFAGLASAEEKLTDNQLRHFYDKMEYVGEVELDGCIYETLMIETWTDGVQFIIFFDSDTQYATVKVSDLDAYSTIARLRGLTTEQFTKDIVYFYLNSDTLCGEKIYKL